MISKKNEGVKLDSLMEPKPHVLLNTVSKEHF